MYDARVHLLVLAATYTTAGVTMEAKAGANGNNRETGMES